MGCRYGLEGDGLEDCLVCKGGGSWFCLCGSAGELGVTFMLMLLSCGGDVCEGYMRDGGGGGNTEWGICDWESLY